MLTVDPENQDVKAIIQSQHLRPEMVSIVVNRKSIIGNYHSFSESPIAHLASRRKCGGRLLSSCLDGTSKPYSSSQTRFHALPASCSFARLTFTLPLLWAPRMQIAAFGPHRAQVSIKMSVRGIPGDARISLQGYWSIHISLARSGA